MRSNDNSLKKLGITAVATIAVAVLCAILTFCYFFADHGGSREIIEIPDFLGQRLDMISATDKIIIESEHVFSDTVPEGVVISQTPHGGAKRKLAEGERYTVRLTVSLGKEMQNVPPLRGSKYTDAAAALRSIGAKIRIVPIYDGEFPTDTVLRTQPVSGERIERGDTVTLFVSRSRVHGSICVRDLVGMPVDDAVTLILSQGLTLGKITETENESYSVGEVVSQNILPGSYVLYGTKIDISVNRGTGRERLHPFRKDMLLNTENSVKVASF